MKIFASVLFGATALAGAALTTVPAAADAGVGVQVGPLGINIGIDQYRDYCRDYSYRHRYEDNCNRYSFNDAYYSERGEDYRWQQSHHHKSNVDDRKDDKNNDGRNNDGRRDNNGNNDNGHTDNHNGNNSNGY